MYYRPAMEEASRMPPLKHWGPEEIAGSEVARYLCDLPAVRQMVFNFFRIGNK
jgi:hypothetical protein